MKNFGQPIMAYHLINFNYREKDLKNKPDIDQVTIRRRRLGLTGIDPKLTAGGFTLFAGQTAGGRVDLINIKGEKIHKWNMPVRPGRDAVLLPNHNIFLAHSYRLPLKFSPLIMYFDLIDLIFSSL